MDSEDRMKTLLDAITKDMDDEDVVLGGLQSMIASEITVRRIKRGLSQKECARLLGVSQGLLSKWESGDTNFTLSTLVHIAGKLEIEVQSPFVPTPPKVYQTANSNIYAFPGTTYISAITLKPQYMKSTTTEELQEM